MPLLQEHLLILTEYTLNSTKFQRAKTQVASQCDRIDPELGGQILAIDVNVRWLVWLVTMKIDAVRTGSQ